MRELLAFELTCASDDEVTLEEGERVPLLMHAGYPGVRAKDLSPTVYKLRKEDDRLREDESAHASEAAMGATMSLTQSIAVCIRRAQKARLISATGKPSPCLEKDA
eukprot:3909741-Pleurochrysis_carterae.AAC.2